MNGQEILGTQAGIAAILVMLVKLFKGFIRMKYGLPPQGSKQPEDPEQKRKYSLTLKAVVLLLATFFSFLGVAFFGTIDGPGMVEVLLLSIMSTFSAVGGSEVGENVGLT